MKHLPIHFFASLAALLAGLPLLAQGPTGPEFTVNAYTTGDQTTPIVAVAADGTFLVGWHGPAHDAQVRLFDPDGQPLSGDVAFPSATIDDITADPAGDFVVTWSEDLETGSGLDVFTQRFSSAGSFVGSAFQVNTSTLGAQQESAIDVDPTGGFLVAWTEEDFTVYARRLDAAGQPTGAEIFVGSPGGTQRNADIAVNGDGDFLVVWEQESISQHFIRAQFFEAPDVATGGPLFIDAPGALNHYTPAVDADSAGRFLVTWHAGFVDAEAYWILPDGTPAYNLELGDAEETLSVPRPACDGAGRCVVAWGHEGDVDARWLTSAELLTEVRDVNDYTTAFQGLQSVDCTPGGDCVIAWQSSFDGTYSPDGSGRAIRAQRFTYDPSFRLQAEPFRQWLCAGDEASYPISITAFNGFSEMVTLGATSELAGATLELVPDEVPAGNEVSELRFSSPSETADGVYAVTISGTGSTTPAATGGDTVLAEIVSFDPPLLEGPADETTFCAGSLEDLAWNGGPFGMPGNVVEVARDEAFTDIVFTVESPDRVESLPDLPAGRYFWRISACAAVSEVRSFEVIEDCAPVFESAELEVDTGSSDILADPAIALACDGRGLVAWTEEQDGARSLRARWLQDGALLDGDFQVNAAGSTPEGTVVRRLENGDFAVLWNDGSTLHWRHYDAQTLAGGAEHTAAVDAVPAALDISLAGDVAALWRVANDLLGARFDAAGNALGTFSHTETTAGVTFRDALDIGQSDEGFVISWSWFRSEGLNSRTQARVRLFDAAGQPLDVEVIVEDAVLIDGGHGPIVGDTLVTVTPEGPFAVHFERLFLNFDGRSENYIRQRRFSANGTPDDLVSDVEATSLSLTPPELEAIAAAAGPNGQYLVAWNDSDHDLQVRRMVAPETAATSAPPVTASDRAATETAVAVGGPSSAGAIVWISDECPSGSPPCLLYRSMRSGPGLLVDDFESGDLGAWCRVSGGE